MLYLTLAAWAFLGLITIAVVIGGSRKMPVERNTYIVYRYTIKDWKGVPVDAVECETTQHALLIAHRRNAVRNVPGSPDFPTEYLRAVCCMTDKEFRLADAVFDRRRLANDALNLWVAKCGVCEDQHSKDWEF